MCYSTFSKMWLEGGLCHPRLGTAGGSQGEVCEQGAVWSGSGRKRIKANCSKLNILRTFQQVTHRPVGDHSHLETHANLTAAVQRFRGDADSICKDESAALPVQPKWENTPERERDVVPAPFLLLWKSFLPFSAVANRWGTCFYSSTLKMCQIQGGQEIK